MPTRILREAVSPICPACPKLDYKRIALSACERRHVVHHLAVEDDGVARAQLVDRGDAGAIGRAEAAACAIPRR